MDTNLVDAQQARRVLDRIVGYKVSPLLWDKVRRGLSAGRVQTVAVRLIVEREQEIRAFVPVEYWSIHAMLDGGQPPIFEAKLSKYKGEDIEVSNQEAADKIVAAVSKAKWQVASVNQREKKRNPPPPFTTSKLQQASYNRLRYTAKRTMGIAQRLYEGVDLGEEGSVALITYMRTDSVNVSADALTQVREMIPEKFGSSYLPEKPNYYKSKKDAQEAHEAVRPTDVSRTPEDVRKYLDDDLFKLYQLIWQRFVASQMMPAVFDQTTIDISAGDYTFRATGSVQKFDGYLRVYQTPAAVADRDDDEKDDDGEGKNLPRVEEGQVLRLDQIRPDQHFTEPPPRYTEATLVKELEEKGIGRPSTYASIISTIVEREYVRKDQGRFTPTMLGERVNDFAGEELRRRVRRDIYGAPRRRARRDRRGQAALARCRARILGKVRRRSVEGRRGNDFVQGRHPDREEVREVRRRRVARAHQPARILPWLLALSRLRFHSGHGAGTQRRRREQDRILRKLRQGNADEARPLRRVPGVQRLSGLQDDAATRRRHAHRSAARRAAGRKVPALQQSPDQEARALRDVYWLLGLSEVQVHAADHDGDQVPQVQ